MEGSDDAEKFGWTANLGKDLEEAIPTDQIESLCEVYEGNEEWLPLLPAFLLELLSEKIMSTVDLLARKPHCDSG